MAFVFKDLAITLSTSFDEKGIPNAVVEVGIEGCNPQSAIMRYDTCAARTQFDCDTRPENIEFQNGSTRLDGAELDELRRALRSLLNEVDSAFDNKFFVRGSGT